MHWTTPLRQEWLLDYKNPLTERLGRKFFLSIPKTPGVYRFYGRFAGQKEDLLYVGKAKSLRARLNSYRQAKPDVASRKVLWMIWQIQRIEFETCKSERSALLRENELLRTLRPPFNVVNTTPENYVAIAWSQDSRGIRFRYSHEIGLKNPSEHLYGVFKSRGVVRDAFGALIRLFWMTSRADDDRGRYEIPGALLKYKPTNPFVLKSHFDAARIKSLDDFLSGRSRALLRQLTSELLEKSSIPAYFYPRIQEDIETLSDFFKHFCARNRKLCRHFGRPGSFISQHEFDDWTVAAKFQEN